MVEWSNRHPGSLPTLCPDAGDRLHHPSFLIFPPFSPIFPHFPPIFPHFPPFFLAMGTLWVRLWVHYPPPEPGTSEPCMDPCILEE